MKDLAIDENGQIMLSDSDLLIAEDDDVTEQKIWTILNTQKGDFLLEPDAGFDKYSILGQKVDQEYIESEIRDALITQDDKISEVILNDAGFDTDTRKMYLDFKIITVSGKTIDTEGSINAD